MISLPLGPDRGIDLVRENAPPLLGRTVLSALTIAPEIGEPWPMYVNTIERLLNGQVVIGSRLAAWQYPLFAGEDVLGVAHLSASPLEWAALLPAEYAQHTLGTMLRAQSLALAAEKSYELRLLEIPSVSLRVIWLHGAEDQFLPLTAPMKGGDGLPAVMNEAALAGALMDVATVRLTALGTLGA